MKMNIRWCLFLAMLVIAALPAGGLLLVAQPRAEVEAAPRPGQVASPPLLFVENAGQLAEQARFEVLGGERQLFLAANGLWLTAFERPGLSGSGRDEPALHRPRHGVSLHIHFVGANSSPMIEPFARLESQISYARGGDPAGWKIGVPTWAGVRYRELYPGIDLELTSANGRLVQRLVARPGADLGMLQLQVDGAQSLALQDGMLRMDTSVGAISMPLLQVTGASATGAPTLNGTRISAPFVARDAPHGADAATATGLVYSAIFGGGSYERGSSIAVDGNGASYITGSTESADFPRTTGDFFGGVRDAYVVKVNASGSIINYATFLGGAGSDEGASIALNGSEAYLTGLTESGDFPTTSALDGSYNGDSDAFVARLASNGAPLFATYLGGSSDDRGLGIAVDTSGAAYVTGATSSTNFPIKNALDSSLGARDAFVVKLKSDGSEVFGTFLGGLDYERGDAIGVDENGIIYLLGTTASSDLATTDSAYDKSYNGEDDLFITRLNSSGSQRSYSSYLGGAGDDFGSAGLVVDTSGSLSFAGTSSSIDFPTTSGAYDRSQNGNDDALVVRVNTSASGSASLVYSSYLGGSEDDKGNRAGISGSGSVYISGETYSPNFPTSADAFDGSYNGGGRDVFVARLDAGGDLAYSTFLGGSGDDNGGYIALDSQNSAYVSGYTSSSNFPTTAVLNPAAVGGNVFVTKLTLEGSSPPPPTSTRTPTKTPQPTDTPEPTNTPTPTKTPKPGDTPAPTPNATATARAEATATAKAGATATARAEATASVQAATATADANSINQGATATAVAATASAEAGAATASAEIIAATAAAATASVEAATATAAAGTQIPPTPTPTESIEQPTFTPGPAPNDRLAIYLPLVGRPVPQEPTPTPTATPEPTATPTPQPAPTQACEDIEDNDSPDQARRITPPVTCVGSLEDDPQGEDDYYTVELATGQAIRIDLTSMPVGSDYDLILYNPSLTQVAVSNRSSNADERIDYVAQTAGRFFIRINMAVKSPELDTYVLQVGP